MKSELLKQIFIEFCESQTHLEGLLSKVPNAQKAKIAISFGAFLRRPLSIAQTLGVDFKLTPEEFWSMSFIRLKKFSPIYDLFEVLWDRLPEIPSDGSLQDFPQKLTETWISDWGQDAAKSYARILSQDPLTTIRLHRRARANEEEMNAHFKTDGFPKSRAGRYSPYARVFKGYAPVLATSFFEKGFFEIQDEGSQVMSMFALSPEMVAPLLFEMPSAEKKDVNVAALMKHFETLPAMTVVDACAGGGGKTLAMADLMSGQGRIYAYDVYDRKIQSLKKRAERAEERSIQAVCLKGDDLSPLKKFYGSADRVFLDSPCNGAGVLRRNPDTKWNRKPYAEKEGFLPIEELQQKVVRDYYPLVKRGGKLVYGVCTFQKSETIDQVKWIQSDFPDLKLECSGFLGPYETDGFFMASFTKV